MNAPVTPGEVDADERGLLCPLRALLRTEVDAVAGLVEAWAGSVLDNEFRLTARRRHRVYAALVGVEPRPKVVTADAAEDDLLAVIRELRLDVMAEPGGDLAAAAPVESDDPDSSERIFVPAGVDECAPVWRPGWKKLGITRVIGHAAGRAVGQVLDPELAERRVDNPALIRRDSHPTEHF